MEPGFQPGICSCLIAAGISLLASCDRPQQSLPPRPDPVSRSTAPPWPVQSAATARQPQANDWFEDVTSTSGIDFRYRSGADRRLYTLLETIGGGVAMLDYDQDGDLDLFFAGGGGFAGDDPPQVTGRSSRLYRNDGHWKFQDVTEQAGISGTDLYTHGCYVLDFNRDSFPDLLVTGYGGCRLLRNERDGRFLDVTRQAGLDCPFWCTAAAVADVDQDGWPDIYIGAYLDWTPQAEQGRFCGDRDRRIQDVCPPQLFPGASDRLFRNRGDGTFQDITPSAGLKPGGRALGVLATDIDGDGYNDFYVANDAGANFLYLGDGRGKFREEALPLGVAYEEYGLAEGSMGVDFGDYNGDGRGDLFVTNFELEENSLYRQEQGGLFRHATVAAGLTGTCFPYVGFGTALADFDGDNWLDLLVINGSVFYHTGQSPYYQPAFVFQNDQGHRFHDVSSQAGPYFSVPHVGRGVAVGDLDNDGAPDLVVVHQNDPVTLLRNRRTPQHWFRLELQGNTSEPRAVGARVEIHLPGRTLTRWIRSGAGYLSTFDPRLTIPLDAARDKLEPVEVEVVWPSGKQEVFALTELAAEPGEETPDRSFTLIEGQAGGPEESSKAPNEIPNETGNRGGDGKEANPR